jgi:hypothetical protein
MNEFLPFALSALMGALIWRRFTGRARLVLSSAAVTLAAAAAVLVSGEVAAGGTWVVLDVAESVVGLAVGFAVARYVLRRNRART